MKQKLLLIIFALIPFFATGCQKGTWKDYNTPKRFLNMAAENPHRCNISMYGEKKGGEDYDYNLEVRNALIEAGNFKKTTNSQSTSSRFFTYCNNYIYPIVGLSPALYCVMSVYDDGFISIDCESFKEDKHAYFLMDAEKAYAINDLVFEKIPRDRAIKEENKKQAYIDGTIDNFIIAMEKKSPKMAQVITEDSPDKTSHYIYTFEDTGEVLSLIKDLEHEEWHSDRPYQSREELIYNPYDKDATELSWSYYLYDTGDYAELYYHYYDGFGYIRSVEFYYRVDATKGKEIVAKALEIAKK